MAPRNPADVYKAMHEAFDAQGDARTKVMAVRTAMLTPAELTAADSAPPDERTDEDFGNLAAITKSLIDSARYTAPELFFSRQHAQIGQAILRQSEIDAINQAFDAGLI